MEKALAAGLLIGLTAFWNGAAVIGGLLILMGFAVSSDGKLDYLLTAVVSVMFSVLQSRLFIRGSAVETSFSVGIYRRGQKPWRNHLVSSANERYLFSGSSATVFCSEKKKPESSSYKLPFSTDICFLCLPDTGCYCES